MLLTLLVFLLSLIVLLKGSDVFVEAAARIARMLGISEFVIGLTLVAVGTSMPELGTSIMSAMIGNSEIIIGNAVGSNIANIGLILGLASVSMPIEISNRLFRRDSMFMLLVAVVFFVLSLDGVIGFFDGILFLGAFLVYLYTLMKEKHKVSYEKFLGFLAHPEKIFALTNFWKKNLDKESVNHKNYLEIFKKAIPEDRRDMGEFMKQMILAGVSCFAIVYGAKFLVGSSIDIASRIGISEEIIGLSAIAIGTSLPELFVTFSSARKGLGNILAGNLIGSSIANILLVVGIPALMMNVEVSRLDIFFTMPMMILMSLAFVRFIRAQWFSRILEGVFLLAFYALFIVVISVFGMI